MYVSRVHLRVPQRKGDIFSVFFLLSFFFFNSEPLNRTQRVRFFLVAKTWPETLRTLPVGFVSFCFAQAWPQTRSLSESQGFPFVDIFPDLAQAGESNPSKSDNSGIQMPQGYRSRSCLRERWHSQFSHFGSDVPLLTHTAMNPRKWLVDMNPHPNGLHPGVPR